VRGPEHAVVVFRERHLLALAVHLAAREQDHLGALDVRGFEHDLGAADVRDEGAQRIVEHVAHAHGGGKVEDAVALGCELENANRVGDAALDEMEVGTVLECLEVV